MSSSDEVEEDDYNSDDPENWGPYYWSEQDEQGRPLPPKRVWDNVRYYSFKGFRSMNFAGEVLVHFFGLNNSRYQWMIDLQKREAEEEEYHRKEAIQREQYQLEKKLKKERKGVVGLEQQ